MSIKRVCDFCGKLEENAEFLLEKGSIHMCGGCLTIGYHELLSFKEQKRKDAEQHARGSDKHEPSRGDANTA